MTASRSGTWWALNWKWAVPAGCLSGVASVIGFIALMVSVVFGMMKSSTPFRHALATAKTDPVLITRLGAPIRDSLFPSGNISVNGADGSADLAIPITGSKGSGTLYVKARKAAGAWTYSILTVQIESSGTRISLLRQEV